MVTSLLWSYFNGRKRRHVEDISVILNVDKLCYVKVCTCVRVFMCIFACVYNALSFRVLQLELYTDKLYRSCQNTTYKILIVCFSVATYFIYAEYFLCILSYLRVSPCSVYTEICYMK